MTLAGSSRGSSSSHLGAGARVAGRYEVRTVLGEGATGVVYDAQRLDASGAPAGPRVALKILHPHLVGSHQLHGRFRREARILQLLDGQNLVRLVDSFHDGETVGLALDYVEGQTLDAWVSSCGPISARAAVEMMLQVCAALGVAHAAGVVHRDLKPANVLVTASDSASPHVRVVDFGLAKLVHGERMVTGLTEHDMIFGTPEYMAPEQARGDDVDERCDLYAAGVMLYELLTGDVPFRRRTPIAVLTAHLTEEPEPPRAACARRGRDASHISPALEAVVLRALAKERSARFASAKALAEALAATLGERHVVASLAAPASRAEAEHLGASDTDLAVAPPSTRPRSPEPQTSAPAPDAQALEQPRSPDRSAPILFWALAVAFAIGAVALGVLFGAR